jgi:hypothetical protein
MTERVEECISLKIESEPIQNVGESLECPEIREVGSEE